MPWEFWDTIWVLRYLSFLEFIDRCNVTWPVESEGLKQNKPWRHWLLCLEWSLNASGLITWPLTSMWLLLFHLLYVLSTLKRRWTQWKHRFSEVFLKEGGGRPWFDALWTALGETLPGLEVTVYWAAVDDAFWAAVGWLRSLRAAVRAAACVCYNRLEMLFGAKKKNKSWCACFCVSWFLFGMVSCCLGMVFLLLARMEMAHQDWQEFTAGDEVTQEGLNAPCGGVVARATSWSCWCRATAETLVPAPPFDSPG